MFSWIKNLKKGLTKSSTKINSGLKKIFKSKKIEDVDLEQLHDLLVTSDIGVSVSEEIIEGLRKKKFVNNDLDSIKNEIYISLTKILSPVEKKIVFNSKPHIVLLIGVNGSGKTSSIGKLAKKFSDQNKTVGIIAADTFRAAAVEQLKVWAEKTHSIFFSSQINYDPSALIYKSITESKDQKIDVFLIDTAGRLHNKSNLMDELSKIIRVLSKIDKSYPHEIILVIDGNTGQNSLQQAEKFSEISQITGLIITKLDGTARGGVLIPISKRLKIPIYSITVGESQDDLIDFNAKEFSKALLGL